jgi:transposase
MSQSALARQVGVHRRTIQRWIARPDTADRTGGLRTHGRRVVTDVYRDAVIAEWQAHPRHGPKRSAQDWRLRVPTANTATVWRILHAAGLTRCPPQKNGSAARFRSDAIGSNWIFRSCQRFAGAVDGRTRSV